ncbi:hypothetical protein ACH4ND_18080 [Streptomyces sp. NPDC017179]|uniref:hypothetical protein n=1 Tax=Streptomyces sp. NPDC017179 TaxID=3364979 RepID=UPI0037B9ECF2
MPEVVVMMPVEHQHPKSSDRAVVEAVAPTARDRGRGFDWYVTREGRHCGTVLVDIETRRPVDSLPDWEAATPAAWLARLPGAEVVCRDRAPLFATVDRPRSRREAIRIRLRGPAGRPRR